MLTISGLQKAGPRLSFTLDGGPANEVWFETQPEYESWFVTDRYDAAVLSLLPYAMKTGQPIRVRGGVTGPLLHALRSGIMPILKEQLPSLHIVDIHADVLPVLQPRGDAVLTGLSCGVDSLSTVSTFKNHEARELRLTHVGFFNVGSHYVRHSIEDDVFRSRLMRARKAASELSLPLVEVVTNVTSPFWAALFGQHHTLWNCAVAIALGNGVRTYLYSSAMPFRNLYVGLSADCAYADAMLVPLLAQSGVSCISSNAQMERVEKTALIADWPFAQRWLDVCALPNSTGENCSVCIKCCRTLLALEVLRKIDAFSRVFDLSKWEDIKTDFTAYVALTANEVFSREIIRLAERHQFRLITPRHRIAARKKALVSLMLPYAPPSIKWRLRRIQGVWAK